jgi:hypothetical protein
MTMVPSTPNERIDPKPPSPRQHKPTITDTNSTAARSREPQPLEDYCSECESCSLFKANQTAQGLRLRGRFCGFELATLIFQRETMLYAIRARDFDRSRRQRAGSVLASRKRGRSSVMSKTVQSVCVSMTCCTRSVPPTHGRCRHECARHGRA